MLGAGLAGSVIAPQKLLAVSETASHTAQENSALPCGRSKVVASDAATVVETTSGKIRGYERNGIYIFKGAPYGASTSTVIGEPPSGAKSTDPKAVSTQVLKIGLNNPWVRAKILWARHATQSQVE